MGDRDQLLQVMMNLVDNSLKYSRDSGGEVIINVEDNHGCLRVRVIDNGIGIPKDDLPYLFETAYRSPNLLHIKKNGSGLGLAIVKRIIVQHGGSIEVESILGMGSTFSFELPIVSL
jgi:signal transduction histidine kinase